MGGNVESAFVYTSDYIYLFAICAFVMSAIVIFFKDIVRYISHLPVFFIELLSYTLFGTMIYYAEDISKPFAHIVGLPPTLFISVTSISTIKRLIDMWHEAINSRKTLDSTIKNITFFTLNTMFYAAISIYIDSVAIGYICIACLMCLISFIAIDYCKTYVMPAIAIASFVVMTLGAYFKVMDPTILWFYVDYEGYHTALSIDYFIMWLFVPPMLWFGSFFYYGSLLVMSSRDYTRSLGKYRELEVYIRMQLVCIVSGIMAIYFGRLYDIVQLYGVSGTVVSFYVIMKVFELASKGRGIYVLFVISLVILVANTHIRSYLLNNGYEGMIDTYFNLYPSFK